MIETQVLDTHYFEDLTDDNNVSFWRGTPHGYEPAPGTVVRYFNRTLQKSTGYGIVVASINYRITVLWSVPPRHRFQFPTPPSRMLTNTLIQVQPMSIPRGEIFYLDYKYGSGSK